MLGRKVQLQQQKECQTKIMRKVQEQRSLNQKYLTCQAKRCPDQTSILVFFCWLNNKVSYKKLQYDPTQTHSRFVNDTITNFKNDKLITEKIAKGLQVEQPDMPKFYTRPKIHKTGNPGSPVVSSVNCHTYTIPKYVDFHLQPIVKNIPSYVRDTTDFLQKLDKVKNIPNDCLLVTLDVKSLYTNIPNNEGIKAVREAYDNHPNKTVVTKVILTFLSLILTFVFNSISCLTP